MKHPARVIALAVGVVVVALAVLLASQVNVSPSYSGGNLLGKPVPEFALPSLTGGPTVRSADFSGRVLLVNFWNSWCIPCQQEHGALASFYAAHKDDRDFAMVGIVRDDAASAARSYVQQHHDGWTFATDPSGQAALHFGTTGQPESYMVSPSGVIIGFQRAAVSVTNLEDMLRVARQSG